MAMGALCRAAVGWWLTWGARLLSLTLLLFWGAFFLAHLSWFSDAGNLPPLYVFAMQTLHLAMLIGLALGWRWPVLGAIVVLVSTIPFFWYAAGPNFLAFTLITNVPALLWLIASMVRS